MKPESTNLLKHMTLPAVSVTLRATAAHFPSHRGLLPNHNFWNQNFEFSHAI